MLFFLRAASLLDGLLLSYPLLAILEVSLTGRLSAPLSLPRLGIVLLSGALGAFIGWLLDRMKTPPVRAITLLLAAAPAAGFTAGCWYPVSYTPLDVSKRQVLKSEAPAC